MSNTQSKNNERNPLEVPQQFANELRKSLSVDNESSHSHLSVDDLHGFACKSAGNSDSDKQGNLIIVGRSTQLRLLAVALRPTELCRVYDIMYLQRDNASLHQYQPAPAWAGQDSQQTYRRALEIYVDEERDLGADGKSPFEQFHSRFCRWYSNLMDSPAPDRSNIEALLPLETTKVARDDGSVEKQVIWSKR